MANADETFSKSNFIVEIEGVAVGGFSECTGLDTESAVIEYRNGNEDTTVRKIPGLKKFGNIVLKRGITRGRELWEWRKQVMDGRTERRSGSIILLDEGREEVLRWNFHRGWPARWSGPALNSMANEIAIETLEIAHEGLELS
jgi:phage tail-like protein